MTTQIDTNSGLTAATENAIMAAAIHFKRAGNLDLYEDILTKGKDLEESSKTVSCLRCVHSCTQLNVYVAPPTRAEPKAKTVVDFSVAGCALAQPVVSFGEGADSLFFSCSMESQTVSDAREDE